ncbi:MAG TPA: EboA domain-containing protein [Vicinamibacterales bacterium]|nr:EboA domain-containing protein [Vicinamibacterales bacterium]
MLDTLIPILRARCTGASRAWLDGEMAAASPGRPAADLIRAYTVAPRRIGRASLALSADERELVAAHDPELALSQWTVDDAARAAILLAAASADPSRFQELALACYENGDAREQQSWLRSLPMFPAPERFVAQAIDACRTNIVPLFEAIACENPFPARFFPERNFNQLVLKALFNTIGMSRIVGLARRLNPELSRMAADYVKERQAASRAVPPDIWDVIAERDAAQLRQEARS